LQIDERNVRAVTKDFTRATYPAWRQLMWYGEVAAKGKKSNSCPASNSGRTFAAEFCNGQLVEIAEEKFRFKIQEF
jgi:hypothetical protein